MVLAKVVPKFSHRIDEIVPVALVDLDFRLAKKLVVSISSSVSVGCFCKCRAVFFDWLQGSG